jgi:hypothetical protein
MILIEFIKISQALVLAGVVLSSFLVTTEARAEGRYIVDGERLYFDMEIKSAEYQFTFGLEWDEAAVFGAYLMDHPDITTLVISGTGGSARAAYRIAELVELNQLDVVAQGRCHSACSTIFLAGQNRYLARGARLGFHASFIRPEGERAFFERSRETRGWNDVFDYVPSVYASGISAATRRVEFFSRRGVDLDFILQTLNTASSEMYEPTREQLYKAGVLTTMVAPPDEEF